MSSLQMHLLAGFLKLTRKRREASDPTRASKQPANPPAKLLKRHAVKSRTIGEFECHTVAPRDRPVKRAVVYLHGGAYVNPIVSQHWQLISRLADAGVRVEVAHYGLPPRCTYRDAYPFVTSVYRDLLDDVAAGSWVTIMGDSAGGGLALGVAQTLSGARGICALRSGWVFRGRIGLS
jgi:acetyl esterase/lipase